MSGFDCSGLVIEIGMSIGLFPAGYDNTAQGLYNMFSTGDRGLGTVKGFGSLAFFGKTVDSITHVGFMLDSYRMNEAGGGGSKTTDLKAAEKANAFVRVRPLSWRKDLVAIIKPNYSKIR